MLPSKRAIHLDLDFEIGALYCHFFPSFINGENLQRDRFMKKKCPKGLSASQSYAQGHIESIY